MYTVPAPHLFFKNASLKEPKRFGHPQLSEVLIPLPPPHPSIESHHHLLIIFSFKHMNREVLNLWACHKGPKPICLGKKLTVIILQIKQAILLKEFPELRISLAIAV